MYVVKFVLLLHKYISLTGKSYVTTYIIYECVERCELDINRQYSHVFSNTCICWLQVRSVLCLLCNSHNILFIIIHLTISVYH